MTEFIKEYGTWIAIIFNSLSIILLALSVLKGNKSSGMKEVIDLAKENEKLKQDLSGIFMLLHNIKKGKEPIKLKSYNEFAYMINKEILDNSEVIKEHWKK